MRGDWLRPLLVMLATVACRPVAPLPNGGDQDAAGESSAPVLELLAGDIGGPGNVDGIAIAARFNAPFGAALDSAGNLYIPDAGNHTIRKVSSAGVVTTLAGAAGILGGADGTGTGARFNGPKGIAIDGAGNLYVADTGNDIVRKVTPAGVVTTLAGTAGLSGSTDGTGAAARFNGPVGVAIDSAGNLYVADLSNHTIREITSAGVVTTLAGTAGVAGIADGSGTAARFNYPVGVAVDSAGNLYVADSGNDIIRKVTPAGVVTTVAGDLHGGAGSTDGTGTAARFNDPNGVAVDLAGNLYVADSGNSTIRKMTPAGVVTTLAGVASMPGNDDGGTAARFNTPNSVAVDRAGNLYVTDTGNNTLRKVTSAGIVTTLAGAAAVVGSADGIGAAARFNFPTGMAADGAGNIYVGDSGNNTIRKVSPAGVVTTVVGAAGMPGSADGSAAARFYDPTGVAFDSAGNLYIADSFNTTLRRLSPGGVVTTLAGTPGMPGSADGTGPAARFNFPTGVAPDGAGNLYVVDTNNQTIRKLTPAGIVTTLAGAAGMTGSADGGSVARFAYPRLLVMDRDDNLYVADTFNFAIRKITPAGIVSTLAGVGGMQGSADGAGAAARFGGPIGIAMDGAGNFYVADTGGSTIRRVTPTGITTTIAGVAGENGVVLGASPRFSSPVAVAIVGDALVISDANAVLLLRHVVR